MDQDKLLQKLEQDFEVARRQVKLKASIADISRIFPLKDVILKEAHVPTDLINAISRKTIEILHNWAGYIHGLIVPNPQNILSISEAQFFSDDEKKDFYGLLNKIMELSSRNSLAMLKNSDVDNAKVIDDSIEFWEKELSPKLQQVMSKVNKEWIKKSKE